MTRNLRTWLIGTAAIVVAGVVVGRLFLGEPEVAAPAITPTEAKGHFGLLPAVADNPQNPVTPAKIELGKALFDPRLSKSGFIACASCHHLASGGGDGLATSIGHRWQVGIATFLASLDADPPLTVTLPRLPASTATTPRPEPN